MELRINQKQTGHLMTDLLISKERCTDICNVIEESILELHHTNSEKVTLAQILQVALKHAQNDAETVFISVTAGEYHAQYMSHVRSQATLGEVLTGMRNAHVN